MSATLKIPTIFTAVDKFSSPVKTMGDSAYSFASKTETLLNRSERNFRKLTPALSEASKQFLSFASTAAIAAGIVSTAKFSTDAIMEYEDAVASFRTIVSDASDKDFAKYQTAINEVATTTRKSSIDVAKSFEKIAGLNASFAETADGLAAVSNASITLSKASKMDLGASAENLVGIMNQFSLGALEADRTINVLAAGQAVGAANITQTADAFVNFGSVASNANISLEQSVALVQTLGKFSLFGAEAGTKLRGSVLKLQQAGVGYASGQFQINDALTEARAKLDKLTTAKEKDAYLTDVFGAENRVAGTILLNNIDLYEKFEKSVTGTTEAQKAAAINSQSLSVKLDELKNRWVNILTSSENAAGGLSTTKTVIGFVTDNLDTIVSVGSKVLLFFAVWKGLLVTTSFFLGAYNLVLGINGALTGVVSVSVGKSAIALGAYNTVTKIVTASQWLWNASMWGLPLVWIIAGVAALVAVIVVIIKKWNEWGAALSLFLGPIGLIVSVVQSFRRNWEMVKESFATGGILGGLKAIGKVILDAILMPVQQLLELISKIPGLGGIASAGAAKIASIREGLGVNTTTDESGNPLQTPALNPKKVEQDAMIQKMEETQTKNMFVDFKNMPQGVTVGGDTDWVRSIQPNISSSMQR